MERGVPPRSTTVERAVGVHVEQLCPLSLVDVVVHEQQLEPLYSREP